jgi:hypothetical protein
LLFALFSSRSLLSLSLPPASIVPRLRNAIDREVFALCQSPFYFRVSGGPWARLGRVCLFQAGFSEHI